jgi:squalene synthase HpnC
MTVSEAYAYCTRLTRAHYENFPVGLLVPRHLGPHVHAIYAFARYADDLADEGYAEDFDFGNGVRTRLNPEDRLHALNRWQEQLTNPHFPDPHPIFIALHATMAEYALPLSLFTDLLSAFRQDITKLRYEDYATLLDYCRRSANPIGRLVLHLHRQTKPEQLSASDSICTALQLANFWQDISVDRRKNRSYLPQDELASHGLTEVDLEAPHP